MIDDTNTTLAFYPSNKQLSIGDKNVSGINIATGGAAFAANTINIGNTNSAVNIVDTGLNIKYVDQGVTANNIASGYNSTNYTTTGGEYSVSIWGGTNDWGGGALNIPCVLQPYTKYKMTITCRSTQSDMTFYIENPSFVNLYTSPVLTTTYKTYTFTFTNGEVASGSTFILRYTLASSVAVSGKSFIWNNAKVECLCVGVGVTPSYPLDVLGNIRSSGGIYSTGTSRLGAWGFNTTTETYSNGLGTQIPVTQSNYALFQSSSSTMINTPTSGIIGFSVNNNEQMRMSSTGNFGIGTSTPAYKLDVNGGTRITGELLLGTDHASETETGGYSTGTIRFANPRGDNGGLITCRRYSTTANSEQTELLLYQSNDPDDRIRIKAPNILFDTFVDYGYDGTTTNTRMMIDYNGRVGIGTTGPEYNLDVAGTSRLGTWGFNTATETHSNRLGTQIPVTQSNYALFQSSSSTMINTPTSGIIGFSVNNNEQMRMSSTGNFGIGTSTPAYKLDVNGNARIIGGDLMIGASNGGRIKFGGTFQDNDDNHSQIVARRYDTGEGSELLIYKGNDSNDRIRLKANRIVFDVAGGNTTDYTTSTIAMTINDSGFVGIGVSSPEYPLDVMNSVNFNMYTLYNNDYYRFYFRDGVDSGTISSTSGNYLRNYSMRISSPILSLNGGLMVVSDSRIKKSVKDVDSSCLTLFRKLKPKTYQYIDILKNGENIKYGFIAQEVKKIIPEAVSYSKGYISNIYLISSVSSDLLTFDTTKLEYDASGQLFKNLKLILPDSSESFVKIIRIVDANNIQIDKTLEIENCFIYGQEVDNFHTLHNDTIWTVAAAALQEVDRQLQLEKEKTATLQEEVQKLQSKYETMVSKYDSLESNYNQLLQRILALEAK